MFYFAAASFSEMARRVGVQPASARFLCADRPQFAEAMRDLSPTVVATRDQAAYAGAVAAAIEELNIGGLCDPRKRNWYAVDLQDTMNNAAKLGVTAQEVARRCV
jgi:hypothetical protein